MYGASMPIALIMGTKMWWLPNLPWCLLLCVVQGKVSMLELKETPIFCLCRLRGQEIGDSTIEKQIRFSTSFLSIKKKLLLGSCFMGNAWKSFILGQGKRSSIAKELFERIDMPSISLFQDELDDEDYIFRTNVDEMMN